MQLEPYDLRDPGQVLRDVCREHDLAEGDLLITLIDRPSTMQRVTAVRRVSAARWQRLRELDLSKLLAAEAGQLPLDMDHRGAPNHMILTVLVRRGMTVIDGADAEVLTAWRYAHHFMPAYDGGLLLVTDHGWCDFMTGLAGLEPALV